MKNIIPNLFSLVVLFPLLAHAGNNPSAKATTQLLNTKNWSFEQNVGQLVDDKGSIISDIKYFGTNGAIKIFCYKGKLSFVSLQRVAGASNNPGKFNTSLRSFIPGIASYRSSRLDMEFEGSNPNAYITASDKQEYSRNYYRNNTKVEGISSFKQLTYHNLYDNIDMVLISKAQGMEYRFIVHPGGNVGDIKLTRKGMDKMQMLDNGGIRYISAFGNIEESAPVSYTSEKGIKSRFITNENNIVTFSTESYNKQTDLVIDPDLTWASYIGGDNGDIAYGVTTDRTGNVYVAGITVSLTGIATMGAYQTSLAGGAGLQDVFLAKYNTNGVLQWATYYGGDSDDYANAISIDNAQNLYITGYTKSPAGIATNGAYSSLINGGYDAFLVKFSNSGTLIWGTYFGGELDDFCYGITTDHSNNIIIGGYTDGSTTGIATSGAHQNTFGGGWDVILAKFNSKGGLIWSTYYGGSGYESTNGLAADPANNIYLTGFTSSVDNMITANASNKSVDANYGSGFLTKLDSNGALKWGTYYGGPDGTDGMGVAVKGSKEVYITGKTSATTGIATTGAYQTANIGQVNVFLADFSPTGTFNWGTYYGGEAQDVATAVVLDTLSDNIYLTGGATSTTGIASTGGYSTSLDTAEEFDAFLAEFSSTGIFEYGTYYGGDSLDEATGMAVDHNGSIYITGGTTSPQGISTNGAQQSAYGGGSFDGFIAKFDLCNLYTSASGKMNVCINDVASYKAVDQGNAFVWTVTGGTITAGAGTDSIAVKWTSAGARSVKVKEVAISGCRDSVTIPVNVYAPPVPSISGDNSLCPPLVEHYSTKYDSSNTYLWAVTGANARGGLNGDTISVNWTKSGTGKVHVKETNPGGCSASDSIAITILPLQNAKWTAADKGKGVYTFTAADSTNATFGQFLIEGNSITGYHANFTFIHTGTYPVSFDIVNTQGCDSKYDSMVVINDAGVLPQEPGAFGLTLYPNPFSNMANIQYTLPRAGHVTISLTDITGRNLAILEDNNKGPGLQETNFSGLYYHLQPGAYFIRFQVDQEIIVQKLMRMAE